MIELVECYDTKTNKTSLSIEDNINLLEPKYYPCTLEDTE